MGFIIFILVTVSIILLIQQSKQRDSIRELEENQWRLEKELRTLTLAEHLQKQTPPDLPEIETESGVSVDSTSPPAIPKESAPVEEEQEPASEDSIQTLPIEEKARDFSARQKAPTPPPIPEPPVPSLLDRLRPVLERLKLWPPSGKAENAEIALAIFWTTRIGLILMIIAAVFFGVHFSRSVPNWMRVVILFGVATGVTGLGVWLERKFQQFGRLISAGGLALFFFTAFAIFGVPATKITDQPLVSFLAQTIAVILAAGWSLKKRDEIIGSMSVLLGYIACWFSARYGMSGYSLVGLLTLASAATAMHALRGWRWPQVVAIAGSWIGVFQLARHPWSLPDSTPSLGILLTSLVGLVAILEVGTTLAGRRFSENVSLRWQRYLAIANTSAAVLVGYFVTHRFYEAELPTFYLTFSIVLLIAASARFWLSQDGYHRIAETFFLKAATLLCLYFVAEFDGPARWISLSLQTVALLWAWRRSRSLWIEVASLVMFVTTLGLIEYDLLNGHYESTLQVQLIVGGIAVLILGAGLSLYSKWDTRPHLARTEGEPPLLTGFESIRGICAFVLGMVAIHLSVERLAPQTANPTYAFGLGCMLCLVTAWIRTAPAMIAGLIPIIYGCFASLTPDAELVRQLLFTAVTAGGAQAIFRMWTGEPRLGRILRAVFSALSLIMLAATLYHLAEKVEFFRHLGLILFAVGAAGALFQQQQTLDSESPKGQTLRALAFIAGGIAIIFGAYLWQDDWSWFVFHASIASGILFAADSRIRENAALFAGYLPLATGLLVQIFVLDDAPVREVAIGATALVFVSFGTAWLANRYRLDSSASKIFDLSLHLIWITASAFFFRSWLGESGEFLATVLLALGVVFGSRFFPFRKLQSLAWLPFGLAALFPLLSWLEIGSNFDPSWPIWIGAAVSIAGLWLNTRWRFVSPLPFTILIAVIWVEVACFAPIAEWRFAALAGFAVISATFYRFFNVRISLAISVFFLASAFVTGLGAGMLAYQFSLDKSIMRISFLLTALLIAATGIVLDGRRSRMNKALTLIPASALLLAFFAFSYGEIGLEKLTTVGWGLSGVVLFLMGLFGKLRAYRLVGLAGLGLCIVRMFIVDIDDTLYRIIAFFAIAVVLLIVGFLYNRFRGLLDS